MKFPFSKSPAGPLAAPLLGLLLSSLGRAQTTVFWEAFNDYAPTAGVSSDFATWYELRLQDSGGPLRNIATGEDLAASVLVAVEGAVPDAFGANAQVNAGSPAYVLFNGKVDVGNDGIPGIRSSGATKLTLNFSGLDPARRYVFRGTVSRGGGYNDRWSVFGITGANSFVAAHADGSLNKNILTKATFPAATLEANQVALNSGENKVGSLVGWNAIEPAPDGTFAIEAEQYVGSAPFGNPSAGPYGYGFTAIYLAETEATGTLRITENPESQRVPAGQTATLHVVATSTAAIAYQWQKEAPGAAVFSPIPGASQATYVTPVLGVGEDGAKFRCLVSSGGNQAFSTEATVTVDGVLPTVASVRPSVNLNALHLDFSEAMDLELLADITRYQLNGGVTVLSAVALSPTQARLLTTPQVAGQEYIATLNLLEDLAGNRVAANTAVPFRAFVQRSGAVGLELWTSVLGATVADLRGDIGYPSDPDIDYSTESLDSIPIIPDGPLNAYGGRLRAWITPQVSGDYEFFLRADDQGELWLGPDDDFENLEINTPGPIAIDITAGDSFQEPGFDGSTSTPVTLEAGQRYALQALWKEANGGDHCQVAWRLVGDPTLAADLQPISGDVLSYYGPSTGGPPKITQVTFSAGKVIIGWTGGDLQSSADLKTWATMVGAVSPLTITPAQKNFYRVKQ